MGVRGHAHPQNFGKCTCCNGFFSAFWIIFSQILSKYFDPNSECFANMMHFVRAFSIMRANGVRVVARSYRKIVYIKNIFENGW